MTTPAFQAMRVEEYLRSEKNSPVRHEYVGGFVYPVALAGTSDAHALIAGNIFAALHLLARRKGCYTYASDMQLMAAGGTSYYYPDVMVTCEPRQDNARHKTAPCLYGLRLFRVQIGTTPICPLHARNPFCSYSFQSG